jgi:hypothetical protein
MKRYKHRHQRGRSFNHEKRRVQEWKQEHDAGGFRCSHCRGFVVINEIMGTVNRNHCNICMWSKHVDNEKGDRKATCHGGMQPIGLTFKHEGIGRIGEVMFIHLCSLCSKISINRIARDDPEYMILEIFKASLGLDKALKLQLQKEDIDLLAEADEEELYTQLYGNH